MTVIDTIFTNSQIIEVITRHESGVLPTLRLRFEAARNAAATELTAEGQIELAARIKQFQFRDIRPKAASEIGNVLAASKLLGHTEQEITKKVYIHVGESVNPTK